MLYLIKFGNKQKINDVNNKPAYKFTEQSSVKITPIAIQIFERTLFAHTSPRKTAKMLVPKRILLPAK